MGYHRPVSEVTAGQAGSEKLESHILHHRSIWVRLLQLKRSAGFRRNLAVPGVNETGDFGHSLFNPALHHVCTVAAFILLWTFEVAPFAAIRHVVATQAPNAVVARVVEVSRPCRRYCVIAIVVLFGVFNTLEYIVQAGKVLLTAFTTTFVIGPPAPR